jgi:hypothetical protein
MRSATRLVLLACVLGILAVSAPAAPGRSLPGPSPDRVTVEPSPPLVIELDAGPAERTGRSTWRARLDLTLAAGPAIRNLDLRLLLPDGVAAEGDIPERAGSLLPEETRRYGVTLALGRGGALPVQVEAAYDLPDGRRLRALQGLTLRVEAPAPAGRHHAGAYEFMAVPLAELPSR